MTTRGRYSITSQRNATVIIIIIIIIKAICNAQDPLKKAATVDSQSVTFHTTTRQHLVRAQIKVFTPIPRLDFVGTVGLTPALQCSLNRALQVDINWLMPTYLHSDHFGYLNQRSVNSGAARSAL